jgi:peroxiredoxin
MRSGVQVVAACVLIACCGGVVRADDKAAQPAPATAPAANDARAMLERAATAAKSFQAVAYSIDTKTVGGMLEGNNPPSRAAVKALRSSNANAGVNGWLIHVSGASTVGESSKPFDVAWKASGIEVLDHEKKVLMERGGKSVMAPGVNIANRARLNDVLTTNPYQQSLRAANIELAGTETLDGVECDIISAGSESQTVKISIARTDNFPRKIEMVINSALVQSTITTLITGVRVETDAANVTLAKEEDFKLALPEGYTEDRQAAASQPRPAAGPVAATPKYESRDQKPVANEPKDNPAETKPADEKPAEAQPAQDKPSEKPRAEAVMPAAPVIAAGGDFTLKKSTGEEFKFADLNDKVKVVQFFGSWCLPCREWHNALNEAVEQGRDGKDVPLIAISTHERESKNASSELAKSDGRYLHLVEGDAVAAKWGVTAYPATFVIGAAGNVVGSWQGPASEGTREEVAEAVRSALASTTRVAGN